MLPRGEDNEREVLVDAWGEEGRALILDQEEGQLVTAKDRPGFLCVERHEVPQVAPWRSARRGLAAAEEGRPVQDRHDVVAFLVHDVRPRPYATSPQPHAGC